MLALASCLLALVASLLPVRVALAKGPLSIDVAQSFVVTGRVPEGVDGTFEYELAAIDGAPLPADADGGRYGFALTGDATKSIALSATGSAAPERIAFDHVGEYSYRLSCLGVAGSSSAEGLSVDNGTYDIRVSVQSDPGSASGLRIGWVEVRDSKGEKPAAIAYRHSFAGAVEPGQPDRPGEKEPEGPTVLGLRLPKTGDASWGMIKLSAAICVVGVVALVVGLRGRRDRRR